MGGTSNLQRLDRRLLRAMRTRCHTPAAEGAARALTAFGEWGIGWSLLASAGAALDAARRERWARAAAVAPLAIGANYLLKVAVGRPRPKLRRLPPLGSAPSSLSFPSAHATSSFAAATAIGRVEPRARLPLYSLALAIGASRPYLGMHYPSDVIAGGLLGLAIGGLAPAVGERTLEERMIDLVASREPERG